MTSVDFITFCHWRDVERLYSVGELQSRVESHKYAFNEIYVVHQRLRNHEFNAEAVDTGVSYQLVRSEDHPNILTEFSIPEDDPIAEEKTHGPTGLHYWQHHTINHLIGLKISNADYIVFSDCDCRITESPDRSWVDIGIEILRKHENVLIVSPSDGGTAGEGYLPLYSTRLTRTVSQQLFLCERKRLRAVDFAIPWNWEFLSPGEPFQEYYYLLEGRLWRWMHHNKQWRAILPDTWRYRHDGW